MIGIINLTLGFAEQGHDVTVLALNTKKHYFNPENLPPDVKKAARFIAVDIDTTIRVGAALKNLFTSDSYNVERFYSEEYEEKLIQLLTTEQWDMILLEGIYLMRYIDTIREHSKTKVVLRPQNVEHVIWERLSLDEPNPVRRQYLNLLTNRMKDFEQENINKADLLVPVSEKDLQWFKDNGCTLPSAAVPTGYRFDKLPEINLEEESAVGFIGGMDWMPNVEGIGWFVDRVWQRVLDYVPDAKVYIAGRNFPAEIKDIEMNGVVIVGEVEDAREFIMSKSISIVPLFAGSGMRVKIVEAMALGRAIVSTSIGAESLKCTHNKDVYIADRSGSFALHIIKLLKDQETRMKLGQNAQQLVREVYDNRIICSQIIDFCKPHLN